MSAKLPLIILTLIAGTGCVDDDSSYRPPSEQQTDLANAGASDAVGAAHHDRTDFEHGKAFPD